MRRERAPSRPDDSKSANFADMKSKTLTPSPLLSVSHAQFLSIAVAQAQQNDAAYTHHADQQG